MRRLLIFTLLSIICYSTITSILPTAPKPGTYKVLLDSVYGAVSSGNFTYWTFAQAGPLIIELYSATGDADLFVSDTSRPSYEADRNNFSSETCGTDMIYIPDDFPRPFGIGVYGHWSHSWSEYSMMVYFDLVTMNSMYQSASQATPGIPMAAPTTISRTGEAAKTAAKEAERKRKELAAIKDEDDKPRFLKLFKVLDTVFDLVVL
ncbi:UPF0669 protein C6orf120 homolog [Epargyreus clarus]|uniref:UPF0669 protein C6orf120 homolog n=1 Tax=Epargyreus clarus TaxID=520877 RepID=UPI003C2E535F